MGMDYVNVDKQLVTRVYKGYTHFFSNLAFTKGWMKPQFTLAQVDAELHEAAELVAMIRTFWEAKSAKKMHLVPEGSANEYLWSITASGVQDRTSFLEGLVHASLCDMKGYGGDLTEEVVEELRKEAVAVRTEVLRKRREMSGYATKVRAAQDTLADCSKALGEELECLKGTCDTQLCSPGELEALDRLLAVAQQLQGEVGRFRRAREAQHADAKEDTPMDEAADSTAPAPVVEEEQQKMEEDEARKKKEEEEAVQKKEEEEAVQKKEEEEEAQKKKEKEEARRKEEEEARKKKEREEEEEEVKHVQIINVKNDVSRIKDELHTIHARTDVLDLESESGLGVSDLDELQRKCNHLNNELMNNILKLDGIVGVTKDRALKKEQVQYVNSLLDDVEAVQKKLKTLREIRTESRSVTESDSDVSSEAESGGSEPATKKFRLPDGSATAAGPGEGDADKEAGEEAGEEGTEIDSLVKSLLEEADASLPWEKLRLRPRFDVHEAENAYQLRSYMHGVQSDDVEVSVNSDAHTLTVSGKRIPSAEDIADLERGLEYFLRHNGIDEAELSAEDRKAFLMRMGSGRFGTFREQFAIPRNVDASAIQAQVNNGTILINLPVAVRSRHAQRRQKQRQQADPFGFLTQPDFIW